jgi:aminopeptidase
MTDPRITNLARLLVHYSIEARSGQSIGVSAESPAEPLVLALYDQLLRAGAFPVVQMMPEGASVLFYRSGRPHHFSTLAPFQRALARCVDATIDVYSQANTRALSGVDPLRQVTLARTRRPVLNVLRRKPWVLTLFPTQAYAQDAEMSLTEFEDFVYGATFADESDPVAAWRALHRRQERLIRRLRGADEVHIVGEDTDLRLSVKNRRFLNSDGHHNMPSGEIYTGPVESSAEGRILYDFPICHAGREIDGVRLVFRAGRVVEATATKNEDYLRAMLDSDTGARRLGELGIGTNERIQRFTKTILFDEKIGGTVHLALGRSYPETGGRNQSAIHWDMIKDLRHSGALYVNGKAFMKDGVFLK